MPQLRFGQQHAALPKKFRRYARIHTCNPWPVLEHMAQTRASRLTIFICLAFSSAQVPSEMITLTLWRRESSWFSLCQRENLLDEAKQVDVCLRRNEGREGRAFPTWCGKSNVQWLPNSFTFPNYAATVLFVVLGRALRLHVTSKLSTQEAKRKMLPRPWQRLFGLMRDSWPAPLWRRAAPQPLAMPADLKEHVHHRSWTYLWACASRIRYGHIQTKLTFICGFSLNPPPPPPPILFLWVSPFLRFRFASVDAQLNFFFLFLSNTVVWLSLLIFSVHVSLYYVLDEYMCVFERLAGVQLLALSGTLPLLLSLFVLCDGGCSRDFGLSGPTGGW